MVILEVCRLIGVIVMCLVMWVYCVGVVSFIKDYLLVISVFFIFIRFNDCIIIFCLSVCVFVVLVCILVLFSSLCCVYDGFFVCGFLNRFEFLFGLVYEKILKIY